MQIYANIEEHKQLLEISIKRELNVEGIFEWISPLSNYKYKEYSGGFLESLGLRHLKESYKDFWPLRTAHWDALAKIDDGTILLFESKSHTGELKSRCRANDSSINQIKKSLKGTYDWLKNGQNQFNEHAWLNKYYQFANRLAHLYYFRGQKHMNNIWLVNIYFENDFSLNMNSNSNKYKTADRSEWEKELNIIKEEMGLINTDMRKYGLIELFLKSSDIKGRENLPLKR
ncbi:MAG: hypothetical protein BWY26_00972 [Elusimicrobia bacterium ADurb.Bin231]|nr:MAG: hypothetical protein BWY26_00972 [Elusimicrobia bacterium ADurb.Bin231]